MTKCTKEEKRMNEGCLYVYACWYMKKLYKVFVYAVALAFKANSVNIMFGNKKKLNCLCGTHVFWVETAGSTKHLRAVSSCVCQVNNSPSPASSCVCQVNNSPGHCSCEQYLHWIASDSVKFFYFFKILFYSKN